MEEIDERCPNCDTPLRAYLTLSNEEATYCPNYLCDYESRFEDWQVEIARRNYINGLDSLGFVFEGLEKKQEGKVLYQDNNTVVTMGKVQKELNQLTDTLKAEISKPRDYIILLENIIGYDGIKRRLRANINHKGHKKIHTLIVGAPGTSKTVFLKSLESELVPQGCSYHYIDGSTLSKSGLLDYLFDHDDIEVLAIDEIDKVEADHQKVFLNMLESGVLQTTTHKNIRKKDVKEMTVIATGNELPKIVEPVRNRFQKFYIKAYTKERYMYICSHMLVKKYPYIQMDLAEHIAEKSWAMTHPPDMREGDRIGNSIRENPTKENVDQLVGDMLDYAIPDEVRAKLKTQA